MRFNIITMRVGLLFSIAATEIEERASREYVTHTFHSAGFYHPC